MAAEKLKKKINNKQKSAVGRVHLIYPSTTPSPSPPLPIISPQVKSLTILYKHASLPSNFGRAGCIVFRLPHPWRFLATKSRLKQQPNRFVCDSAVLKELAVQIGIPSLYSKVRIFRGPRAGAEAMFLTWIVSLLSALPFIAAQGKCWP